MLFPLKDIRPTQMEIGLGYVASRLVQIQKRNPDLRKAIQTRVLPAAIGSNGEAYITDGHHWALASQILAEKNNLGSVQVSIEVVGDFSKRPHVECMRFLYEQNEGYFKPEVRAQFGWLDPHTRPALADEKLLSLYEFLPKMLEGMDDNPRRSLMGYAFDSLGIFPEDLLTDYVEFYLIEKMDHDFSELGIPMEQVLGIRIPNPEWIESVKKAFVLRADLVSYLTTFVKPQLDKEQVRKTIHDCVNRFRMSCLGLPPI